MCVRNSLFGFVRKSFCITELFCQTRTDNPFGCQSFSMELGGIFTSSGFDFQKEMLGAGFCASARMCMRRCAKTMTKRCVTSTEQKS